MRSIRSGLVVGLVLILGGTLFAQPPDRREPARDKEKPAKGATADAILADGSTIRITLVSESVELETKYGKLSIPASDIQRIEFAFRLPDDVAKKIDAAVKRLGDTGFEEREAATQELREIGLRSYPALEEAARSTDAEVKRRAGVLLEELRGKVSEDDLNFPKKDRIVTAEFDVIGRITSPVLRAKTSYFGEANLKLADIRVLQASSGDGARKLTVDAAKYGSAANQWMETAVTVERGLPLKIAASGQVDLWPAEAGQYMTTPKGYGGGGRTPAMLPGSLVGKIGEKGTPFLIGDKYDGKAPAAGKLYLHIMPSQWGNASSGTYEVKIGDR